MSLGSFLGSVLKTGGGLLGKLGLPGGGLIGAGVGALGGLLSRPKEDPRYAANTNYLNQLQGIGPPQTAGIDPYSKQAFGLMQGLATNGPNISQFYDPYQSQVIDSTNRDIGDARTAALRSAADLATRDRTFGGTRSGIMGATALGAINKAGIGTLANLRSTGFQNAVQAAQQQQQFGLQAAQGLAGAGDYSRSVTQAGYDAPFNRLAATGPLTAGQLYAGQPYQQRPSVLQSALGGALAGFGLFKKGPQDQPVQGPQNALAGWLSSNQAGKLGWP